MMKKWIANWSGNYTTTTVSSGRFRYINWDSRWEIQKLINNQPLEIGFLYHENPQMNPEIADNVQRMLVKYYDTVLPKDFNYLDSQAIEKIAELVSQKKFSLTPEASTTLKREIIRGMEGMRWNFVFTKNVINAILANGKDKSRILLANGAFAVFAAPPGKTKRTKTCWVLPYRDGWLFFDGKYITSRKMCRMISEWSGIPYRPNIGYSFTNEAIPFKRDSVHFLAPSAEQTEQVKITLFK